MGKHGVVALFLFLSLSAAPIDAFRLESSRANIQTNLHAGALAEVNTEWQVFHTHDQNCARYKSEFEQRTIQVQQLTEQMNASGGAGSLKTAQTVLRLRSMTRVFQRASTQECAWVNDRNVDTTALRSTVTENLADNECFPQAQALMMNEWETQQEQVRAMHMATQFLTTRQCTEEDAKRIAADMDGVSTEQAEVISVDDQLEAANEDADAVTDELVEGLMNQDESLMQVGEGSNFVVLLNELVGLVAFLLIWAVMCIVFVPVILMVIGAVLCTLSWVIRRFLGRHQANLGNCMGWWAHQTNVLFAPGNELVTAGACLLAGWFGVVPNIGASFPHLGIYIR